MKSVSITCFLGLPATAFALCLVFLVGCHRADTSGRHPQIATSTSYLEAVARDLLGETLEVARLAEPGTCPGHFDIRPSQTSQLRQCRILLRFDFQKSLDSKLAGSDVSGPKVAEIVMPRGMCRPDSYLAACRQTARQMEAIDMLTTAEVEARVQSIGSRLHALSQNLTNRVFQAGLTGRAVLASSHQRDFCQWLGLKVVSTFRSSDATSIGEVEDAIKAGQVEPITLVIANLPEGRRMADALGERLQALVVVFEPPPTLRTR